jgi:hypothetical protein
MSDLDTMKAARRKAAARRKSVDQALKILKQGIEDLDIKRSYKAKLIKDITSAKVPTITARRIVKDLRQVHSATEAGPAQAGGVDLSAATEARATITRRQPEHLRGKPAYSFEIVSAERAVLKGDLSQSEFNALMKDIAEKPLPAWMAKTAPTDTEMHPRPAPRMDRRSALDASQHTDEFPAEWLAIPAAFDRRNTVILTSIKSEETTHEPSPGPAGPGEADNEKELNHAEH